jgi:hypothetical protein
MTEASTEQRAFVHLRVVETLLDAAVQAQSEAVREQLWSMTQELDATLVQKLIEQPKYERLRPLTQRLFTTIAIPPSDEVRQRALTLHNEGLQEAWQRARGKI